MLEVTESWLRSVFKQMHGPSPGKVGRDLKQHPLRGTYFNPVIASLWNQHKRTFEATMKLLSANTWFDPLKTLPDHDGALVWVYDSENKKQPLWPATWDAENQSFSAATGWFNINEVTRWQYALVPILPKIEESAG